MCVCCCDVTAYHAALKLKFARNRFFLEQDGRFFNRLFFCVRHVFGQYILYFLMGALLPNHCAEGRNRGVLK